ncbi:TRAP transporter small permease [Photobacterium sp. GSS17]|uniref:TRAP transporter small permease n=1 Tax=Photobacterium sp. GSS17 TaxID=3020715 RepID=UPI00235E08AD|nr:TRAP transporter small permease [Photobacterium sp. GSS17]
MQRLFNMTEQLLSYVLCALLMLLTVSVIWQVIGRYVLTNPATWPDEIARFSLIWVAMLGGAFVYGKKKHLAVTILPEKLAGTVKGHVLEIIHHCLVIIFGLIALVGGYTMAMNNFEFGQVSPVLKINMGYVYSAVPFSGLMLIVFAVYFIAQNMSSINRLNREQA